MAKIKVFDKGILSDDNHAYPDDGVGFYSTHDVCKLFDIKMETLQQWLKDGYVKPAYRVDYGRGQKSVFLRSQLVWIGVYKTMLDRGMARKTAAHWSDMFYGMMKSEGKYDFFDLVVLEFDGHGVNKLSAYSGGIRIDANPDGNDILIINVRRILRKISDFT